MSAIKFCGKCGKKLIKEPAEGFDVSTGKRKFKLVCAVKKCGHTGTGHIEVYPRIFGNTVTCASPGCNWSREIYYGI